MVWIGGAIFVLGLTHVAMTPRDRNRDPAARWFTQSPRVPLLLAIAYALCGLGILLLKLWSWYSSRRS
jgi:hypothetical protein